MSSESSDNYSDNEGHNDYESSASKRQKIQEKPSLKILRRSYRLTKSGSKRLEIYVAAKKNPTVMLRLYDQCNNGIVFDFATWKNIYKYKEPIQMYLNQPVLNCGRESYTIDKKTKLKIRHCFMHQAKALKFASPESKTLVMMKQTYDEMIKINMVITNVYIQLKDQLKLINERFEKFSEIADIAYETGECDKSAILDEIKKNDTFDSKSVIDAELMFFATPDTFLTKKQ